MGPPLAPQELHPCADSYYPGDSAAVVPDGGFSLKMPVARFEEDGRFSVRRAWASADKAVIFCCDPAGPLWETSSRLTMKVGGKKAASFKRLYRKCPGHDKVNMLNPRSLVPAVVVIVALPLLDTHTAARATAQPQSTANGRPMTFLDMQEMRQIGSATPSPDGRWLLYTVNTPDWKEARRQSDIYLVSTQQGVTSTKQMTFTKEKNEGAPEWSSDGTFFLFTSNREAPSNASNQNQLYLMRPDGGEARKITDATEGDFRLCAES
jgi:hypothetical protein